MSFVTEGAIQSLRKQLQDSDKAVWQKKKNCV